MAMRISNENGFEANARNWGRFALSMIPAALGGAAVLWMVAASGCIDLAHEHRLEQRTMQTVGITSAPKVAVTMVNHDDYCMKVESSLMDGDELVMYVRNNCKRWIQFPNYSYRVEAHDKSVIDSGKWAFDGDKAIGPSERREQRVQIKKDDRIEQVEVSAID